MIVYGNLCHAKANKVINYCEAEEREEEYGGKYEK